MDSINRLTKSFVLNYYFFELIVAIINVGRMSDNLWDVLTTSTVDAEKTLVDGQIV